MTFASIIFSILLALLLLHEMDAIRKSEWKMFIYLKDLDDERAYQIFTLFHFPLYAGLIFLLISPSYQNFAYYVVDLFLLIHTLIHLVFEKHKENHLKNNFSRSIIFSMGFLAVIHLLIK